MNPLDDRLLFYSQFMPSHRKWLEQNKSNKSEMDDDWFNEIEFSATDGSLGIFDCRQVPIEFIEDTGSATLEDLRQTCDEIELPFPDCYFEFSDGLGICIELLAASGGRGANTLTDEDVRNIEFDRSWQAEADRGAVYPRMDFHWLSMTHDGVPLEMFSGKAPHGEFANGWKYADGPDGDAIVRAQPGYEPFEFCYHYDFPADLNDEKMLHLCGVRMLGVWSLLRDKLLAEEIRPDPAPKLTAARHRRGLPPASGETRILRVNVPAIRHMARATPLGTHESPCLHWRRGHERVLHRGSEFEDKTWVRKCLVGDPGRGFVRKHYRLTVETPMFKASQTPTVLHLVGSEE